LSTNDLLYDLKFLNEFGLSDIQIKIYNYLLNNRFGTIKDIKNKLNYSYSQVRNNLVFLEDSNFITSSDGKPKIYFRSNPKIALTEILKTKNNRILEDINKLDINIQANESERGYCTRNITFYHHSDINIGIEYIQNLIDKAQQEIILSSLSPSLLRKLERALKHAYLRGVDLNLYYSDSDFEEIQNYFGIITDILKDIKIQIIETNEKTCRFIKFNDMIVNEGVLVIDGYFNSVLFIEDSYFHFNGFYMPNMVQNIKNMLTSKTVIKSIQINPDPIQNILDIIQDQESIKTRDLSLKSKISGIKLKEILEYLLNEGLIKEEIIKSSGAGRPKHVFSIVEQKL